MKRRIGRYFLFSVVLTALISAPPAHSATPLAWNSNSVPAVAGDEIQALFGDNVFSADSNLNWSRKMTPTELAKDLVGLNNPWIYFALPPCSSSITIGCIESVQYQKDSQAWQSATLSSRELRNRNGEKGESGRNASGVISTYELNVWPADMANHSPAGGKASYWKFEGAPHGGGNEYLLRVNIAGIDSPKATWSDGKVQRYLEMGLFPVNDLTEYQFPDDLTVKIRLRLGTIINDLWGWFDGRISDPEVTLDTDSALGILEIAGQPSKTPMGLTPKKKLSELTGYEISNIFACPSGVPESQCPKKNGLKWFSTDGNSELSNFEIFERNLGKASTIGYKTEWWIKTTRWPNVATVDNCAANQKGFNGIVTTNASMYSPSAPRWDPVDKSFEFQVASPHLGVDGKPNKGKYTLILPRNLAECRWGKDISNAKVVLSITNSEGTNNIGIAQYSLSKNLLTFNISGFTYSSPKIKVGLAPQANSATKTTLPAKSKSSITITCVKGKITKKVTGQTPKCPAGYVKR